MKNSRFCFTHNPETKDAKKLAVIKGGKSPKKNLNPLPPIEIYNNKDVVNLLSQTINEVRQGKVNLRVANCIGYLSGHLLKALQVADIEERVERLEKIMNPKKRFGRR